jgi:hypothetical protein
VCVCVHCCGLDELSQSFRSPPIYIDGIVNFAFCEKGFVATAAVAAVDLAFLRASETL